MAALALRLVFLDGGGIAADSILPEVLFRKLVLLALLAIGVKLIAKGFF